MPSHVDHDQLLRTMDALIERSDRVEAGVSRLLRPLLDQQLSVVFYDLTTVRIHGECEVANDLRAFGMNKETGGIARQFVLGVVQSAEGLPRMHTVHAGNVSETKTLQSMLEQVLKRFSVQRVIVVADRGLLSLSNLDTFRTLAETTKRQLQFILAVPARRYAELGGSLETLSFKEGIAEAQFADHRLVVAHDPTRAAEQSAKRRARIMELERFGLQLATKLDAQDEGLSDAGRRATDRGAYSRFQRAVSDAALTRFIKADLHAELFSFAIDEAAIQEAERYDGKLVLLTNVADFTAKQILERYKSLADIERGFRVLKSDLEIAPVHHRLPERIRAHALICFFALTMHRVMRMRLQAAGQTISPCKALQALRLIQNHKVSIGDQAYAGISKTTPQLLSLFDALGVPHPPKSAL